MTRMIWNSAVRSTSRRTARLVVVATVALGAFLGMTPVNGAAGPAPVVLRIGDPVGDMHVGQVSEDAGRSIDVRRVKIRVVRGDRIKVSVRIREVRTFRRFEQRIELVMAPVGRGESLQISGAAGRPVEMATRPVGSTCEGGRAWSDDDADTLHLVVPRACWRVDRRGRAKLLVATGLVQPNYRYRASDGIDWTRGIRLR